MRLKPLGRRETIRLGDGAAAPPARIPGKKQRIEQTERDLEKLDALQRMLFADARHAVLIVLQGRDASGKDGAIRHVFGALSPQGCEVTSFKAPTEIERRHDFLWRVHQRVPPHGTIGIFNRSHYEDVLVPRVMKLVPRKTWEQRYDQINDFERLLVENGTVILKFFLHISRDEQKRRLTDRLEDPSKNWKFRLGDLDDRMRWPLFTAAYRDLLRRCNTPWAPWYVVPADNEKVRNWMISRVVVDALERLKLRYPPCVDDIRGVTIP